MKTSLKRSLKALWTGWGYSIFIAIIIATSFKSAIADWNVVPTGSMKPTIVEGDRIFVNKLAYDLKVPYTTWHIAEWGAPQRGEIVVFFSPADGRRLVKRVVGLPGDVVAMENDRLIINGQMIDYQPMAAPQRRSMAAYVDTDQFGCVENLGGTLHPLMISPLRPAIRSFGPVTVPEGKYFMMGDNRDNSADSRYFGFVDRGQVVGRATAIVVSLDILNGYRPRWKRFFSRLP